MQRRTFCIRAGLMSAGCALSQPSFQRSNAAQILITDLEKQIPKWMEESVVPGLSIVVVKNAKIFWRRAFGVTSIVSKAAVDDGTMFEAASMSKPVFAYAVMKL